jgi:hypothetical protein
LRCEHIHFESPVNGDRPIDGVYVGEAKAEFKAPQTETRYEQMSD